MIKNLTLASIVGGLLLLGSAQATQIASFSEVNGTQDFTLTYSGGTDSFTANSAIFITLSDAIGAPNATPITAQLVISGDSSTTGANITAGSFLTQTNYTNGTFTITGTGAYSSLGIILQGTFGNDPPTNGSNSGLSGGAFASSATFSSSDGVGNYGEVLFQSNYFVIAPNAISALGISLSSLVPVLTLTNGTAPPGYNASTVCTINGTTCLGVEGFTAAGSGTFSTTIGPEPGTLALLGSALVGLALLGRKRIRR